MANLFGPNAVLLSGKGEGNKRARQKGGSRSSGGVNGGGRRPELDVGYCKRVRIRRRSRIFSWAKEKKEGHPHEIGSGQR